MAEKLESHVRAGSAKILPFPSPTPEAKDSDTEARASRARTDRERELEERIARWKEICDAGGIDAWVRAQLVKAGYAPSSSVPPSDKEKGAWKEKKKAEADEKRKQKKLAWRAYHATHVVHLGAGVHWDEYEDPDHFDPIDRDERAKANGLPDLRDAQALAEAMGLTISRLRWLTYHREVDTGSHYRRWSIPKRNGKARTITAPKRQLKAAQRWALKNVFEKLPVHGSAHGFLPARSIVSNAEAHAGADVVVKVDIKDFFPTITWRRVKGLLRASGVREQVATLLALLATEPPREPVEFRGKQAWVATGARALPQGAPTSPAITNALCLHMDKRLAGLARKFGFKYTRYADDLAFSWSSGVGGQKAKAPIGALLHGVNLVLTSEGFTINEEKTKVLRTANRQRITGLVVNAPPKGSKAPPVRVPRETVRNLEAAIHNREKGKPGKGESLASLRGMASFVSMVDPAKGKPLLARVAALEAAERSKQARG